MADYGGQQFLFRFGNYQLAPPFLIHHYEFEKSDNWFLKSDVETCQGNFFFFQLSQSILSQITCKVEKCNIRFTSPGEKSSILDLLPRDLPTIDTLPVINLWYKIPFLQMYFLRGITNPKSPSSKGRWRGLKDVGHRGFRWKIKHEP